MLAAASTKGSRPPTSTQMSAAPAVASGMVSPSSAASTSMSAFAHCHSEESGLTVCERQFGSMNCTESVLCVAAAPHAEACHRSACASVCAWREGGSWRGRSGPVSGPPCQDHCPDAAAAADAALARSSSDWHRAHRHARSLGLSASNSVACLTIPPRVPRPLAERSSLRAHRTGPTSSSSSISPRKPASRGTPPYLRSLARWCRSNRSVLTQW